MALFKYMIKKKSSFRKRKSLSCVSLVSLSGNASLNRPTRSLIRGHREKLARELLRIYFAWLAWRYALTGSTRGEYARGVRADKFLAGKRVINFPLQVALMPTTSRSLQSRQIAYKIILEVIPQTICSHCTHLKSSVFPVSSSFWSRL